MVGETGSGESYLRGVVSFTGYTTTGIYTEVDVLRILQKIFV